MVMVGIVNSVRIIDAGLRIRARTKASKPSGTARGRTDPSRTTGLQSWSVTRQKHVNGSLEAHPPMIDEERTSKMYTKYVHHTFQIDSTYIPNIPAEVSSVRARATVRVRDHSKYEN